VRLIGSLLDQANYSKNYRDKVLGNRVGVYLGAMADGIGNAKPSELVNSISNLFGLQGPSIAIDTMSSSSMTAIHMACEALKNDECRAAIASGIYLLRKSNFVYLSSHRLLGSHMDSRSFSNSDGLLLSEAMGAVLLKTLDNALKDNDKVLAVIKSSTLNHAGNPNGSFAALTGLIATALKKAKVEPRTISYVEASANGLPVADALEVGALTKVFSEQGSTRSSCVIGSVKSNIGHAAAASGMSQLAKVVLQLQHQRFVPSIKVDAMNANISLNGSPFMLQRDALEWSKPTIRTDGALSGCPRRALINSFGGGGSYASLVVQEYENGRGG
jgi:polyketide synthase PksN